MRSNKLIHIVHCHAEGEVGDVIVGGVVPPPGKTIWEQARFIEKNETLRNFVLNEPRGGVFRHVNLLVPPKDPEAHMGWIIMEPADTPPMSGSNSICVATVLLDTGIIQMQEPITYLKLEPPMGTVEIKAECKNGKAERIFVKNVPSFVDKLDAIINVEGIGKLRVDTAFGGDSFVIVNIEDVCLKIEPKNAKKLAMLGVKITAAANEQLGFNHPDKNWNHISFCAFIDKVDRQDSTLCAASAVAIRPGKIDRSPTGTFCSARMAVMHARGIMKNNDKFIGKSIIGTEFHCHIDAETTIGNKPAIIPVISGKAWITGTSQYMLDPDDPFPNGYRLSDTWPAYEI